jgi:hypothetical protein
MAITGSTLTAKLQSFLNSFLGELGRCADGIDTIASRLADIKALVAGPTGTDDRGLLWLINTALQTGPESIKGTLNGFITDVAWPDGNFPIPTLTLQEWILSRRLQDDTRYTDVNNLLTTMRLALGTEADGQNILERLQAIATDQVYIKNTQWGRLFDELDATQAFIGDSASTVNVIEALMLIRTCVCYIASNTPPLGPATTIPDTHLCGAGRSLAFVVRPEDFQLTTSGTYIGCPASLYGDMSGWSIVERRFVSGEPLYKFLLYSGPEPDSSDFIRVTVNGPSLGFTLYPLHGFEAAPEDARIVIGEGADVTGVGNSETGCKSIAILTGDSALVLWAIRYDAENGGTGYDQPSEELLFYRLVA